MNIPSTPETTEAEHYNIATPKGRSNLFKKRIEELTKSKVQGGPGYTIDEAIHELRTGAKPEDVALLSAMGDAPSKVRSEKLNQQKHSRFLTKLADENANLTTPSPEVATAMKLASNARSVVFNARLDQLLATGKSLDKAVDWMRFGTAEDQDLLKKMGGL
jgi:hypothetical protein